MTAIRRTCVALLAAYGFLTYCPTAAAQTAQPASDVQQEIEQLRRDFDALKADYERRLAALEAKLAEPAAAPAAAPPAAAAPGETPAPAQAAVPAGAAGAGGPAGALPIYGAQTAASKIFNPDIAVIGDFLGAAGRNPFNPPPALEMHESEASFQAVVDPYARADFFVAFGQEGVEVEEGYLTLTALPAGLLTKVGKMRAEFGKVNTLHNHVLPWADRPLVTERLVGGEEGISDAGFSVARLIPNPWLFVEATGQVFAGNSGDLFHAAKRTDLTYVGHLRGYHDLTEASNLDFGFSFAHGNSPAAIAGGEHFKTDLYGVDATFRWKPLQRALYRSFLGRAEWIHARRKAAPDLFVTPSGMYASGDYQFARRWSAGARFDRTQSFDDDLFDTGGSVLLTFRPSEFSQVRGQYRRINYALSPAANELLFQFLFSIGAHGAHPF